MGGEPAFVRGLVTNSWLNLTAAAEQPSMSGASLAYVCVGNLPQAQCEQQDFNLLAFGGVDTAGLRAPLWSFSLVLNQWSNLALASSSSTWPATRGSQSGNPVLLADGYSGFMIFGGKGVNSAAAMGDTWVYRVARKEWLPVTAPGPPPRFGHSAALIMPDTVSLVVVHGGCFLQSNPSVTARCDSDGLRDDTWMFNAKLLSWTKLTTSVTPPATVFSLSCSMNGMFYLIGGMTVTGSSTEVWGLQPTVSSQWQKLADKPTPVSAGGAVCQPAGTLSEDRIIVYGGFQRYLNALSNPDRSIQLFGVTSKTWTDLAWQQQSFARADTPGGNAFFATEYISPLETFVTFGGFKQGSGGPHALWGRYVPRDVTIDVLSLSFWKRLEPSTSPEPRAHAAAAPVLPSGDALVVGGQVARGKGHDRLQSWRLRIGNTSGVSWEFLPYEYFVGNTRSFAPTQRFGQSLVAQLNEPDTFVMFGGMQQDLLRVNGLRTLADTWLFRPDALSGESPWTNITSTDNPKARAFHTATQVPGVGMVVYGGTDFDDTLPDTWVLDVDLGIWSRVVLETTTEPVPRFGHVAGLLDGKIYVFGGSQLSFADFDDTWVLELRGSAPAVVGTWQPVVLRTSVLPPPRSFAASLSLGGSSLLVSSGKWGGDFLLVNHLDNITVGGVWTDMWMLRPCGTIGEWIQLDVDPTASPSAKRYGHDMVQKDGIFYLVGGWADALHISFAPALSAIKLQCNSGFSTATAGGFARGEPCNPCPQGSYRADNDDLCQTCPGTYTKSTGATNVASCTVCEPSACHGNGHCTVTDVKKGVTECRCFAAYVGSDQCKEPVALIVGLVVPLTLCTVGAIVYLCWRAKRRESRKAFSALAELEEKLLEAEYYSSELLKLERTYQIEDSSKLFQKKIGKGTSAKVFQGEYLGVTVAVKLLRDALVALDDMSLEEFEREMILLRSLKHENVVRFVGYGTTSSGGYTLPFFVTELMANGSLREVLDSPLGLPLPRKLAMSLDVARGMEYLHGQDCPVLHRDIKAENCFVDEAFRVKIGDLGMSRNMGRVDEMPDPNTHERLTSRRARVVPAWLRYWWRRVRPKRVEEVELKSQHTPQHPTHPMVTECGTRGFRAPEVILGIEFTTASDVFSYGMLLYEIATRKFPFYEAESSQDAEDGIVDGFRPSVPEYLYLPDEFRDLMTACWTAEAADRPTFGQIVCAIQQVPTIHRAKSVNPRTLSMRVRPASVSGGRPRTHSTIDGYPYIDLA